MQTIETYERELHERLEALGERVTDALKQLLERKHLYQSIVVDFGSFLTDLSELKSGFRSMMEDALPALAKSAWMAKDKADRSPPLLAGPQGLSFATPDVKLFCATCDRTEAFNSISSEDFVDRGLPQGSQDRLGEAVQVFALSFECQSCKSTREVFLVRRQGQKLTQSGRAPIEHVEIPRVLPKTVQEWYSGALVAHQSGQTLAGVFLLRTVIEQWARETTKQLDLPPDKVLDAYMDLLPQDFKARFRSLRDLYSKLSVDIHNALGSAELFDEAIHCIVEHFEARRLFEPRGA